MSRHEAELIRFPALPPSMQLLIANTVEQRVSLQNEYRQLTSQEPSESTTAAHRREVEDTFASIDLFIDEVICSFLGIGNSTARLNNS